MILNRELILQTEYFSAKPQICKKKNSYLSLNNEIQMELDKYTEYCETLENKIYKNNLQVLKQIKDPEIRVISLQQYIVDLTQGISVYIPKKNDEIDQKMAEFINNLTEASKIKIMFMRLSEGTY